MGGRGRDGYRSGLFHQWGIHFHTQGETTMREKQIVGTLTWCGSLICAACHDETTPKKLLDPVPSKQNTSIRAGDTYSNETCDFCGQRLWEGK